MDITRARQNETIDMICLRVYGKTAGATEQMIEANPQLDYSSPFLEVGTLVYCPELTAYAIESINLWD